MKHTAADLERAARLCQTVLRYLTEIGDDAEQKRAFGRSQNRFAKSTRHTARHLGRNAAEFMRRVNMMRRDT